MTARFALGLIGALIALAPAHAQDMRQDVRKDTVFEGGPYDGIILGHLVRASDGKPGFGLKPSAPNASPLPASLAPQVTALLGAYEANDAAGQQAALTSDVTAELCEQAVGNQCRGVGPAFTAQFAEHCTPNTPFFMKADGRVRIEWLFKRQLYYISYLDFRGGKVSHIRTIVADVPPIMKLDTEKPNG